VGLEAALSRPEKPATGLCSEPQKSCNREVQMWTMEHFLCAMLEHRSKISQRGQVRRETSLPRIEPLQPSQKTGSRIYSLALTVASSSSSSSLLPPGELSRCSDWLRARPKNWGSIPGRGKRFFFRLLRRDALWDPPASYTASEAWNLLPSNATKFRVPQNVGKFLSSWTTGSPSRSYLG
jgi:hypothetical protein